MMITFRKKLFRQMAAVSAKANLLSRLSVAAVAINPQLERSLAKTLSVEVPSA